jgi:asparagine synthase (glutamine-hydrolysing)
MCGIAGFCNPKDDFWDNLNYFNHILESMTTSLHHRGPDDHGIWLGSHCGLAHTRLSIIDLLGGSQPMTRHLGNYSFTIVYNGELYNTASLKQTLIERGVSFQTTSDTEVILMGFITYGPDFVKQLDGIFAFAIWDERHQTLYLFRDSFGIKPIFYSLQNDTLIFSSEIKGILTYPDVHASVSRDGLCEILGLGPARNPGSAVLDGFRECLPGHYIAYNRFGLTDNCYWRLESRPHTDDYETTLEKTSFLVTDAIKRQMISDVPICTFLSGGLDSSLVSAICANELAKKGEKLATYSFDFDENERYFQANSFQPSQDRPYVDQMVSSIKSDHKYLFCDNHSQADLLKDSVLAHDLPCMADIDSSLIFFCEKVSHSHKVVLTGECADEIFGGYPWFHRPEFLNSHTFPWTPDLTPRLSLLSQDVRQELQLEEYVASSYSRAVSEIAILPSDNAIEANRRRISYLNIRYFMQTLLNRMDRTSMHSGLEARVPYADRALIEYVFNVPWEMKAKDGLVKNLLRQTSVPYLPKEIAFRKKSPYPKTYHPFYEELLTSRLKDVLNEGNSPLINLIDSSAVLSFLDNPKDYGKPWYGQLMSGPQMIAYLLQIHYWLCEYKIRIKL